MATGFARSVNNTTCFAPACWAQLVAATVAALPYPCPRYRGMPATRGLADTQATGCPATSQSSAASPAARLSRVCCAAVPWPPRPPVASLAKFGLGCPRQQVDPRERPAVADRIGLQQRPGQRDELREVVVQVGVHLAIVTRQPSTSME